MQSQSSYAMPILNIQLQLQYLLINSTLSHQIVMGTCQSASDDISIPGSGKALERKFKKIEKYQFLIPTFNNHKIDVFTSNGKITDYISNNYPIANKYQQIDVQSNLIDGKFIDYQFKADENSIGPEKSAEKIEWKRPSEFMKDDFKVFEGIIESLDIKQGKLGDCYLLSSMASISEYPFVVKRIFATTQVSSFGYYGIWLFIDGIWQCVVIDDQFPTFAGKPIYSRNHSNQLWVLLIEKAYAKVYGSYQAIESGLAGIALNALTGAPYEYLCKDSNNKPDLDGTWQFIMKHFSLNHFLTGSSENNDRNQYLGLVSSHSYSILDAQQVHIATKKGKKKQRILKASNPWGRYQWKGRWSEHSDVWSQQLRQQLKFQKKDDGIFWISLQDFSENFGQICASFYNKNYVSSSLPLKFPQSQNNFKGVFLSANTRTSGFLTLIQKDHRFFKKNKDYKYSMARVIVLELDRGSKTLSKYINDIIDCDHDATMEITLEAGQYYLAIEMDWKSSHTRDAVINFYGQHPVQMCEDSQVKDVQTLFNEIVVLHEKYTEKQRIYQYIKDTDIKRITGSIAGYVYYHYCNKSKNNNYLCENVVLKQRKHIEVDGQTPQSTQNVPDLKNHKEQFTVKVFPDQQRIVKLKVQKQGNSFYSFATKIQFYIVQKYSLQKLRELADKKPSKIKTRQIEGKPIDVKVKTYNYSGGIVLLYQNKMDKYAYIQQITFDMDNLELQNQTLGRNKKLQIELQPQSEKMLSFVVASPGKEVVFKTKMSFYLNSPQFKF